MGNNTFDRTDKIAHKDKIKEQKSYTIIKNKAYKDKRRKSTRLKTL